MLSEEGEKILEYTSTWTKQGLSSLARIARTWPIFSSLTRNKDARARLSKLRWCTRTACDCSVGGGQMCFGRRREHFLVKLPLEMSTRTAAAPSRAAIELDHRPIGTHGIGLPRGRRWRVNGDSSTGITVGDARRRSLLGGEGGGVRALDQACQELDSFLSGMDARSLLTCKSCNIIPGRAACSTERASEPPVPWCNNLPQG